MACSDELRKKRSDAAKKRWSDPDFKKRVSDAMKGKKCLSDGQRKNISDAAKQRNKDPDYLKRMGDGIKRKWQDPEYRDHQSKVHKGKMAGENHPMFGKKHTEEAIEKMLKTRGEFPSGKSHPMFGKKHTVETRSKLKESHLGVPLSSSHKKNIGIASKKVWANVSKEKKAEWIKKITASLNISPNKPEKRLINILDELYPNEWKFTGDFSFIIDGKSPDFVNCNGQKKIIELYGDYWHRGQDPQDRINAFKPFGFDTLVIWEHEMKNIESVIDRINAFVEG